MTFKYIDCQKIIENMSNISCCSKKPSCTLHRGTYSQTPVKEIPPKKIEKIEKIEKSCHTF